MSELKIDELTELLEKATPGPWRLVWWGNEDYPYAFDVETSEGEMGQGHSWICRDGRVSTEASARLIVAAVNALPALLTRLREQEEECPICNGEGEYRREELIPGVRRPVSTIYECPKCGPKAEIERLEAERDGLRLALQHHAICQQDSETVRCKCCGSTWHPSEPDTHLPDCILSDADAPRGETFDFRSHLQRQRDFSEQTFGPGSRTKGVVDHIRKELAEIEAQPDDLSEWIDVTILALDGAWRMGASPDEIIAALVAKQEKNEARDWPDWREADPDKAIEHDRSADEHGEEKP